MNGELKQAAQRALAALENSQPHPSNPVIGLTKQDFIDHEETIRQLRNAIQQAAPATQAEVTDEQIAACVKRASTYGLPFVGLLNPGGTPSDFSKRFTVEILALRPVQVPMNNMDHFLETSAQEAAQDSLDSYIRYSITAKPKKDTP